MFALSDRNPVFLHHKVAYNQISDIPSRYVIEKCLKGKSASEIEVENLNSKDIVFPNTKVALGFQFRRDVNKLLKMRKRRRAHFYKYYSQELLVDGQLKPNE